MALVFQSSAVFPAIDVLGKIVPGWLLPLTCMAATSLLMAVVFWVRRFSISRPMTLLYAIAAIIESGAACCALWAFGIAERSATFALYLIGSALLGSGTALYFIEINRLLGELGMRKTGLLIAAAMVVSSAAIVVLSYASLPWKAFLLLVLPPLMIFLYRKAIRQFPLKAYFSHGENAKLYFPWKYLTTAFIQGTSLGIISGGVISFETPSTDLLSNAFGYSVASVLFLATLCFLKFNFNRLVYQIGFPLIAAGFWIAGLLVPEGFIGGLIGIVGYYFVDLSMWCLGSYLIKNAGLPAVWIAMGPCCCLFIGNMVGGVVGWLIGLYGSSWNLGSIMGGIALLLLLSALLLSNESNIRFGWGTLRPLSSFDESSRLESVCNYLESEYALTPRQAETLFQLALGRSRKTIADELFLSEDTVKTHMRSLYQKLSVHSRKELMDLVRSTAATLHLDEDEAA